jgi:hypothetical protein
MFSFAGCLPGEKPESAYVLGRRATHDIVGNRLLRELSVTFTVTIASTPQRTNRGPRGLRSSCEI